MFWGGAIWKVRTSLFMEVKGSVIVGGLFSFRFLFLWVMLFGRR